MKKQLIAGISALILGATSALAQDAPFGTDADADYAAKIWSAMEAANLAGDGMLRSFPYEGVAPHGMMLETFYSSATIDGHTGDLIVKRNYGPEGIGTDEVLADPGKHLGAVTVMFRREKGFDADNQDWFWVKFLPDGSLDKNPKGMRLAGKVAKGADKGCIACHSGAEDYLFTTDHVGAMMQ
ncbi:cytochrome P460 family protein [uncultured Roseovarius sp.]|uniref:cytochrome P460 family protein n=1 Tax=uncultured Roseovarius sp. TaxID=293344 RepID=UPI0026197FAE|nr:cytochrome P460 family protein [uncultured Roseovarius sp.]